MQNSAYSFWVTCGDTGLINEAEDLKMEKQEWQVPEISEIDIAEETQLDPNAGTDTIDPAQGSLPGS